MSDQAMTPPNDQDTVSVPVGLLKALRDVNPSHAPALRVATDALTRLIPPPPYTPNPSAVECLRTSMVKTAGDTFSIRTLEKILVHLWNGTGWHLASLEEHNPQADTTPARDPFPIT
jgi:hypothetical protein